MGFNELEFSVKSHSVYRDSLGNALPQGIQVTLDDGDDVNSGLILFNVIENGARWAQSILNHSMKEVMGALH